MDGLGMGAPGALAGSGSTGVGVFLEQVHLQPQEGLLPPQLLQLVCAQILLWFEVCRSIAEMALRRTLCCCLGFKTLS